MNNLIQRVITSIILLSIFIFSLFLNEYSWLILLLISALFCFLEINNLFKKIWKKNNKKIYFMRFYWICFLIFFIYSGFKISSNHYFLIFTISVCTFSDIGGYTIGKIIGGKKLTKISPKKTISGSIGSFIFSLIPFNIFYYYNLHNDISFKKLLLITLLFSLFCQLGDLIISYFKRMAKVKDTGKLLPGHGGVLDRIDGVIFTIPASFIIYSTII